MRLRLAVIVAALGTGFIGTRAARASGAETYFGCEPGFTFEAHAAAARCRRAGAVLVAPMLPCPQANGTTLVERVDHAAVDDACVGGSGRAEVAVDRSCPAEYTRRVVPGPDRCEKPTPELIRAPSIPVAR